MDHINSVLKYLKNIESISFYNIYLLKKRDFIYPAPDSKNSSELPLLRDARLLQSLFVQSGIVYEEEGSSIFYYVQHFSNDLTCIMGPFSLHAVQGDMHRAYAKKHSLPDKFAFTISKAAPVQAENAMSLIRAFFETQGYVPLDELFIEEENYSISAKNMIDEKEDYHFQEYLLENTALNIPHGTYELEKDISNALLIADEEAFFKYLDESTQYQTDRFATSSYKSLEYSAVILVTGFTRTAMEAGVPEEDAYALSDSILNRLSLMKTASQIENEIGRLCHQFLHLVKKHRDYSEKSLHIKKCKTYIAHHLNQPLTADLLAEELGISKDYLLHLFPAAEGVTLMDYIRETRILAAQNMLKYSDYDIMRIAAYFQFKSQSHFSAVFKKYTGVSPTQYRKSNQLLGFHS